MRNHVSVIPYDQVVIVDGKSFVLSFTAPDNIHAIQWHTDSGHIEYSDGKQNAEINGENDYASYVSPFVSLWEEEEKHREEEANHQPTEEALKRAKIAGIEGLLAEIDMQSVRPLRAILDGSASDFDKNKLKGLENQAKTLRHNLSELN